MKQTDMNELKTMAKSLFMAVPIEADKHCGHFCQHPFTNQIHGVRLVGEFPEIIDYTTEKGFEIFKNQTFEMIDLAKKPFDIIILLNKAYYMTFLKFAEPYLSKEDFSEQLRECWVQQEYPNRDNNVNHRTLIKWFRNASNKVLMEKEELSKLKELKSKCEAEELTLYRGVELDGKPNGLSWTTNKDKAVWFSQRFNSGTSKVYKLVVKNPSNILAYLDNRNEAEVIVDTFKEKGWEEIYE